MILVKSEKDNCVEFLLAFGFCTGIVQRNKSLFTYHGGKSYESFVDYGFTPVFLDETNLHFSNLRLEREANSVCGKNKECLFDVAVTGKVNIGKATLESLSELEKRRNQSKVGK